MPIWCGPSLPFQPIRSIQLVHLITTKEHFNLRRTNKVSFLLFLTLFTSFFFPSHLIHLISSVLSLPFFLPFLLIKHFPLPPSPLHFLHLSSSKIKTCRSAQTQTTALLHPAQCHIPTPQPRPTPTCNPTTTTRLRNSTFTFTGSRTTRPHTSPPSNSVTESSNSSVRGSSKLSLSKTVSILPLEVLTLLEVMRFGVRGRISHVVIRGLC